MKDESLKLQIVLIMRRHKVTAIQAIAMLRSWDCGQS
jgi:hypothetical protein